MKKVSAFFGNIICNFLRNRWDDYNEAFKNGWH